MLARFARAHQITFPMLSDKGSAVIRRYGILNTNIPRTHTFYGIPFPGEYLVAPDGRVADKVFLPRLSGPRRPPPKCCSRISASAPAMMWSR